jgi:protein involved in polysaccharide export with SLBB domain
LVFFNFVFLIGVKMRGFFAVFFLFVLNLSFLFPQITGLPTLQKDIYSEEQLKSPFQQQIFSQTEKFPTSSFVADSFYYVGPNDIFSILVTPATITTEYAKVTADGKLALSRYGFVDVQGKTLLEAKKAIIEQVKKVNPSAEVSISLFQPRIVLIKVFGNVRKPGIYSLPASFRVSDAVAIANLEFSNQEITMNAFENEILLSKINRRREEELVARGIPSESFYSTRNISVFNQIYGLRKADLELSKSRNTFIFDPYIREGDEIYVPFPREEFEFVSVSGALVQPGKYFFKKGDKVSDFIKFAKGFKENADLSNVVVVSGTEQVKVSIDSNLYLVNDFELQPYASIIVPEKAPITKATVGVAGIFGTVRNPGIYPIELGKTRILDLINFAGGIVGEPLLSQSYVVRSYPPKKFSDDLMLDFYGFLKQSNLTMEDTTRTKMNLLTKSHLVSCDFEALLKQNNPQQNILLSDGDMVIIPSAKKRVFVWGQVKNPGFVEYVEGKNYEWYIEKAGGYLSTAKKSRVRIIRGIQKAWLDPKSFAVLDGDEIFVPSAPDNPPGTEIQYYSLIATGIATLISLTYLIINLTRRN